MWHLCRVCDTFVAYATPMSHMQQRCYICDMSHMSLFLLHSSYPLAFTHFNTCRICDTYVAFASHISHMRHVCRICNTFMLYMRHMCRIHDTVSFSGWFINGSTLEPQRHSAHYQLFTIMMLCNSFICTATITCFKSMKISNCVAYATRLSQTRQGVFFF